jgi:hypothetical protein
MWCNLYIRRRTLLLGHCPFTQPHFYVFKRSYHNMPDVVSSIYPPSHTPLVTLSLYSATLIRVPTLISLLYFRIQFSIVYYTYLFILKSTWSATYVYPCYIITFQLVLFVFNIIQYIYIFRHTHQYSVLFNTYIYYDTHINDETPRNVSYCVQYLFNRSLCYYIHCVLYINIYMSTRICYVLYVLTISKNCTVQNAHKTFFSVQH